MKEVVLLERVELWKGLIVASFVNTEVFDERLAVIFPAGITGCLPCQKEVFFQLASSEGSLSGMVWRFKGPYLSCLSLIMGKYAIATEIWCTLSMPAYLLFSGLSRAFPISHV